MKKTLCFIIAAALISCCHGLPSLVVNRGRPSRSSWARAFPSDMNKVVSITKLHVQSSIQFRYARTVVESKMKNFGMLPGEAEFRAIIPDQAFISNFSMVLKGVEYVAEVKGKKEAAQIFEDSVAAGQGAGLVETDTRDAKMVRIKANVEPAEKVVFRLTYDQLLERTEGQYEQVINVNPGQVVEDFKIRVDIDESLPLVSLQVPELRQTNEIDFKQSGNNTKAVITWPVDNDDKSAKVELTLSKEDQQELIDNGDNGEFSVRYDVDRQNQTSELQVIDGYFVHYFVPDSLPVLSKHVIFVLDVSGSMDGTKMAQMKDAMFTVLDDMTEKDHFDLITFSQGVQVWRGQQGSTTVRATKENKQAGIDFVLSLEAGGGTNINDAMVQATQHGRQVKQAESLERSMQTIILFLTDGQATEGETNNQAILSNVEEANKDSQYPIFSLAFGRDADFSLIRKISQSTGARAKQIYEGSDAALQLEGFFQEISSPLLTNLTLKYVGDSVDQDSLTESRSKLIFKGSEYIVAGKLKEDTPAEALEIVALGRGFDGAFDENFVICLRTRDEPVYPVIEPLPQCIPTAPLPPRSNAQNFLKSLYAFLTIKQLIKDGKKDKALEMSLANNFVTDLTSLVVTKPDGKDKVEIEDAFKPGYGYYWGQRNVGITTFSSGTRRRPSFPAPPSNNKGPAIIALSGGSNLYDTDYDSNYSFFSADVDFNPYSTTTTTATTTASTTTTTTPEPTCQLSLYAKTYRRGETTAVKDSTADLRDFNDKAVSAAVEGSCCWRVHAELDFQGAARVLRPGQEYNGVTSLANLFRNLKSVTKIQC